MTKEISIGTLPLPLYVEDDVGLPFGVILECLAEYLKETYKADAHGRRETQRVWLIHFDGVQFHSEIYIWTTKTRITVRVYDLQGRLARIARGE